MSENSLLNRRNLIVGGAVVVAAGGYGVWRLLEDSKGEAPAIDGATTGDVPPTPPEAEKAVSSIEIPYPVKSFVIGDPNAPVKLVEYASLTCPHCANFHVGPYQDLKRDFIETGKASVEVREVFFDKEGLWGAMLARCGGEAKYFGYVDILFRKQKEWSRAENVPAELQKIGRLGGLTPEEMDACLQNNDFARALVEKYESYRDDPLLEGTPTLILDGEKLDHSSFEAIAAAINAKL